MHKQICFQTSFKLAIVAAFVVTIFGWFSFTTTMAENNNIKLSDIQIQEGDIVEYQISADSSYVVYLADQDTDEVIELYSVPTDGSTPPIKLNSALTTGGWVGSYKISADSNQVVYRANQDLAYQWELYSVPIDGSTPPIKLNGPLVNEYVVGIIKSALIAVRSCMRSMEASYSTQLHCIVFPLMVVLHPLNSPAWPPSEIL